MHDDSVGGKTYDRALRRIERLEDALIECRAYFDARNLQEQSRRIGEALIGSPPQSSEKIK